MSNTVFEITVFKTFYIKYFVLELHTRFTKNFTWFKNVLMCYFTKFSPSAGPVIRVLYVFLTLWMVEVCAETYLIISNWCWNVSLLYWSIIEVYLTNIPLRRREYWWIYGETRSVNRYMIRSTDYKLS